MTSIEEAEVSFLPDEQKRDLCLELLDEFGAKGVREGKGGELQHRCTLGFLGGHSDNNSKSASVNYKLMKFNCYVCGYGGDVSLWIALNRREDTGTVEPWLRKRLGIGSSMEMGNLIKLIESICHPKPSNFVMPTYPEKILNRWNQWEIFHPYLTDVCHLPEENLAKYKVGFADWDEDFKYDNRIIIPSFWNGKLVGWQARIDHDDPSISNKYMNSPAFPRDRILFGEHESDWAVVVEAPKSVLRHDHHIPIVSTYGSSISEYQFRALEKRYRRLIFCNENDKAGWKMTRSGISRLSRSVRIDVVVNPYTKKTDPADWPDEILEELVAKAVPGSIWKPKNYNEQIELT